MKLIFFFLIILLTGCSFLGFEDSHRVVTKECFYKGIDFAKQKSEASSVCSGGDFCCRFSCLEGYYFSIYSKNMALKAPEPAMAVGKGLAIGFLKSSFNNQNLDQEHRSKAYIADGIGFSRAYQMELGHQNLDNLCPEAEFGDYTKFCQFGLGRAAFVENKGSQLKKESFISLGFQFAQVFSTRGSSLRDLPIQNLAENLKKEELSESFQICLKGLHIIECLSSI